MSEEQPPFANGDGAHILYKYTDGNRRLRTGKYNSKWYTDAGRYTHCANRENVLDNDAFGSGYRGRKNPVKEWTYHDNGATMKTAYAHAFDAGDRVTTITPTNKGAVVPDVLFTYRQTGDDAERVKKPRARAAVFCLGNKESLAVALRFSCIRSARRLPPAAYF